MGKPKGTRTKSAAYTAARKSVKKAIGIARAVAHREAFLRRWDRPSDEDELDAFQVGTVGLTSRRSIRRGGRKKSKRRTKRRKSRAKRRTRRR